MIFQQNKKMKKANVLTFNFALPAVSTCPLAGECKNFCYALLEQIRFPSAKNYREKMLALSKQDDFVDIINKELNSLKHRAKQKQIAIRIHSSGDFYNIRYINKWISIANLNQDVVFYAYTKSVSLFKRLGNCPKNLIIIYSLGGLGDKKIDLDKDRHARIFKTAEKALSAGYVLANEDDTVAWSSSNNKIGLVIFGARKNNLK